MSRLNISTVASAAVLALAALFASPAVHAFDPGMRQMPAQGTLDVAFSPWDDVESMILNAVGMARRQVLVQAYIFTSKPLTAALIAARRRGVDVRVLVDAGQMTRTGHDRIVAMQEAGIQIREETKYKNAHNKVIVIDPAGADATVITGSYNFTWTAQHKNAENILIARKNPPLAAKYVANWTRHFDDAEVFISRK